ncbi:MAG: hypothetical protein R3B13_32940 [Polyangiaceae bacterium]
MSRRCEVCDTEGKPNKSKVRRLIVAERIVALCDDHAAKVKTKEPGSVSELRSLYLEVSGRRSLLPRRSPLDRRVFPARPEGRRATAGRRADDR